jgi:hypothetical protein
MNRIEVDALIEALSTGDKNTALEVRNILYQMSASMHQSGDIIIVKCDQAYINENFDATGLGKNLREGYAKCNGLNETFDLTYRTPIGHGDGTGDVGTLLGSKNAVVVSHSHQTVNNGAVSGNYSSSNKFTGSKRNNGINIEYELQGTTNVPNAGESTTEGESGIGKNMQPSIVMLIIQKL